MTKTTRFISVEITIRTDGECDEWIEPSADANKTIFDLCGAIEKLPRSVRRHWDNANKREFHIGYDVGDEPHWYDQHLELETLQRAVKLNASIRISMYATSD